MLKFVENIINRLNVSRNGIHVGVVTFSDNSNIEIFLDDHYNKTALIAEIRRIVFMGGNTRTSAGIKRMQDNVFDPTGRDRRGDRASVSNLAIVVTDGGSNIEAGKTIPYANQAKNANIKILGVGITNDVNRTELQGISNDGVLGSTYWMSESFNVTNEIIQNIATQTCENIEPGEILYGKFNEKFDVKFIVKFLQFKSCPYHKTCFSSAIRYFNDLPQRLT